jgi:predicted dienelactone hydrolase
MTKRFQLVFAQVALFLAALCCFENDAVAEYDPLSLPKSGQPKSIELSVASSQRDREIPLRVYLPLDSKPAPCVLFSHGLGGSRDGNKFLGEHLVMRGYVVVVLQHPGSDESVWKDTPLRERMSALRDAASSQNMISRCEDVRDVLDQLQTWDRQSDQPLAGRMNLEQIGMSGHSFGAVTTQAVSGQSFPIINKRYTDKRIDAAIAYSPGAPQRGSAFNAFGSVQVPWMLMTGTKDIAAIGGQTMESRLAVYPNLPKSIARYELVLYNAEHSAFTDRPLPGDQERRNSNHHRAILALSTAFWDAYLRNNQEALQWLTGDQAKKVLEEKDRWQFELPTK